MTKLFSLIFFVIKVKSELIEENFVYFIDHKKPIYIKDNPKSNRKEYEVS